jgi:acetolactate synthase-1/2/3 large subunit
MVRQMQTQFYGERYSETSLNRSTDFPSLSNAFGAYGYMAKNLYELDAILSSLPENGQHVIDCLVDIDEKVLPLIPLDGGINDMLI